MSDDRDAKILFEASDGSTIQMDFCSPDAIMAIWKEWESAHPGQVAYKSMSAKEFGDAMMTRMLASARRLPEGKA